MIADSGSSRPEPPFDPALARDRTALAWTRSALSLLASGTLIARAAFVAHLDLLGVLIGLAATMLTVATWRQGRVIYRDRALAGPGPNHQTGALGFLTATTMATAVVAVVVTIAL